MRVYLGVVARGRVASNLDSRVEQAAGRSLPFSVEAAEFSSWSSPDARIKVFAWSNEPEQPQRPLLEGASTPSGAVGFSGYLIGNAPHPERLVAGAGVGRLGGVWSLFAAHADGASATTSSTGAETVYLAESDDVTVIGSRALLVHLVANPSGPIPDLLGLTSVASVGYCVTDRTPFEGVYALPPSRHALIDTDGRLRVVDLPDSSDVLPVAEALKASIEPLRLKAQTVQLGLTGGRDSRLMAALLTAGGVSVDTRTSGMPDDPDVIVATRVAETLGLPHRVARPSGTAARPSEMIVDVTGRLKEAVVLSEGMLSAYDRVGRIDDRYNHDLNPFGGSGGEILRAYYAGAVKDHRDTQAVVAYMRGRVFGAVRNLRADAREAYEHDVAPWLIAAERDGAAALEEFYVRQRTARWTGAARSAASIGSLAQRPYLDHEVVRSVRAVDLDRRISELLISELLEDLAPALLDIPFAGRRWKFDQKPPTDPQLRAAWELRAPIVSRYGDQATFNWRLDVPEVRRELATVILDAPAELWSVLDRRRVEEMLTSERARSRQEVMRAWHIATVAAALQNDFWAQKPTRLSSAARSFAATIPVESNRPAPAPSRPRRLVKMLRRSLGR